MHRPVAVPGGPTDWNEALDMISFGSHDQVDVIAWSLLIIINIFIIICGTIIFALVIHIEN